LKAYILQDPASRAVRMKQAFHPHHDLTFPQRWLKQCPDSL